MNLRLIGKLYLSIICCIKLCYLLATAILYEPYLIHHPLWLIAVICYGSLLTVIIIFTLRTRRQT